MNKSKESLDKTYLVSMSFFKEIDVDDENLVLSRLGLLDKYVLYYGSPVRPVLINKHIETLVSDSVCKRIVYEKDKIIENANLSFLSVNIFNATIKLFSPALLFKEELDRYINSLLTLYYAVKNISKKSKIIVIYDNKSEYEELFSVLTKVFKNISFVRKGNEKIIKNKIFNFQKLFFKIRFFLRILYKLSWFYPSDSKIIIGSTGRDMPQYLAHQFANSSWFNEISLNDLLYISNTVNKIYKIIFFRKKNTVQINNTSLSFGDKKINTVSISQKIIIDCAISLHERFFTKFVGTINDALILMDFIPKNTSLVTHHHDGLNGVLSEILTKTGFDSHIVPHGSFLTRDNGVINRAWIRYSIIFGIMPCTHIASRSEIVSSYYSNLIETGVINKVKIVKYKRDVKKFNSSVKGINILHASTPKSSYRHGRAFLYESTTNYFKNILSVAKMIEKNEKVNSFTVLARKINSTDLIVEDLISVLSPYRKTNVLIDVDFLSIVNKFDMVVSYSSSVVEESLHLQKKCVLYHKFGGYSYNNGVIIDEEHNKLLYSFDSELKLSNFLYNINNNEKNK